MASHLPFLIIFISLTVGTLGVKIEFYNRYNFKRLALESNSTEKCNNVPENRTIVVASVRADTCVMLYQDPNCISTESNQIYAMNTSMVLTGSISMKSFHACDNDNGGPYLNLDITTYYENSSVVPLVLHEYPKLCSCINIPESVQQLNQWSINNHGNRVYAFFEPNCQESQWDRKQIPAGNSVRSRMMHTHQKTDPITETISKVQSIGPLVNSVYFIQNCNPNFAVMEWEVFMGAIKNPKSFTRHPGLTEISHVENTNGTLIQFFSKPNFEGDDSAHTTNITLTCSNIPPTISSHIGSLTTEKCVILYSERDCIGRSIKIMPVGATNLTREWEATVISSKTLKYLYKAFENWNWTTGSFHECTEKEGGIDLNVDITEYNPDIRQMETPKVLMTFSKMCSCQNVPEDIRNIKHWSINNHGNSLMAYFEEDCVSNKFLPLWISPGRSSYSIGLGSFTQVQQNCVTAHKILSIGPDTNANYFRQHCLRNEVNEKTIASFPNPREALLLKHVEILLEQMSTKIEQARQDDLKQSEISEMLKQIDNKEHVDDDGRWNEPFEIYVDYGN